MDFGSGRHPQPDTHSYDYGHCYCNCDCATKPVANAEQPGHPDPDSDFNIHANSDGNSYGAALTDTASWPVTEGSSHSTAQTVISTNRFGNEL